MDKIRVSKSIMDSLNKTGYAVGKKYTYKVHDKLSPDCIVVERIPRYYYHDGINPGLGCVPWIMPVVTVCLMFCR